MKRFTDQDIAAIRATSWDDINAETAAAYEEYARESNIELTDDEKESIARNWHSFLGEYREVQAKKNKEVHGEWLSEITEEKSESESLVIESFEIKLPERVEDLAKAAEEDPFYYMPPKAREMIIHHLYVMEVVSYYAPKYMIQPGRNGFDTVAFIVEEAKSCGLFFRKVYCVKWNYMLVFFNFTDRTDEAMIEDYKKDRNIMLNDEIQDVETKIKDIEAAKEGDITQADKEEDEDPEITYPRAGKEFEDAIRIKKKMTEVDPNDINSYVYSMLTVVIAYKIKKGTELAISPGRTILMIRPDRLLNVQCKFHNMYFLPTC